MSLVPLYVFTLLMLYTMQSMFSKLYSENYAGRTGTASAMVYATVYGVIIGIATLAGNGFSYSPSLSTLILGGAVAVTLTVFNLGLIQAGMTGSYAFMMVCMLLGAIALPLISNCVFLGDSLNFTRAVGIALMLVSFFVINRREFRIRGASRKFFVWCALLFASNGLYVVAMNAQPVISGGAERGDMIVTGYIGSALLSAAFMAIKSPREYIMGFRMGKKSALFALLAGGVATLAANLFLYVNTLMSPTILNALNNGGVLILSALVSRVFFHEKMGAEKLAGLCIAGASIALLCL